MAQWTARGEASHLQRLIRDRIVLPLLMQVAVGRDHRTRFVHDDDDVLYEQNGARLSALQIEGR